MEATYKMPGIDFSNISRNDNQAAHSRAGLAVMLDGKLTEAIERFSHRHQVSPTIVLLASWGVLFARLTGQDEVVIGNQVDGRPHPALEPLAHTLTNILLLRINIGDSSSVTRLLEGLTQQFADALRHRDLPVARMLELTDRSSTASSPSVKTLVSLHNAPGAVTTMPGVHLAPPGLSSPTIQFDMAVLLTAHEGTIAGSIQYLSTAFESDTVERYLNHWLCLLEAMVMDDKKNIGELPLWRPEQASSLISRFNDTAVSYPTGHCIHELFEAQVAAAPQAVALVVEHCSMTYGELNAAANRLARHLRTLGVGPDQRVAICVERGFAMVVGLLAILKAGGAYVPLDPTYPIERLTYQLTDCAPAVILIDACGKAALHRHVLSVPILDVRDEHLWAAQAPANLPVGELKLTPQHLAYVIYTSGSTGQPKGVMNEHGGAVNRLLWMQEAFTLHADDRVLQKTPFGFDVSVWEFFWPLQVGSCLVIARPDGHKSPDYLAELIDRAGVTTLHFVPSMLQIYLSALTDQSHPGLRRVFCSGEALPASVRNDFFLQLPQVELHNLYGPTEAAVDVTWYPCVTGEYQDKVPIGRPIANTRIYLLDAQGQPVPVGVAGEIYIAGVQVARGYLNRAELTAERFLDDPFAAGEPGARMYRTGDMGRWLPDGNIEYLGRNDFQVKLHGLRIELGEIEAHLVQHPLIVLAAVKKIEQGDESALAAWYTTRSKNNISRAELRSFLKQTLPLYMIPSLFIEIPSMPLNNSGKIDRQQLPDPAAGFRKAS